MSERKVVLVQNAANPLAPTALEIQQGLDLTPYLVHQPVEYTGNLRVGHPTPKPTGDKQ